MEQDAGYIAVMFPGTSRSEDIQAVLLPFDPLGFLDEEDGWTCYFDQDRWRHGLAESVEVAVRSFDPSIRFSIDVVRQENWNAEWENSITPIRASSRFIIAPSWHPAEPEEETIVLTIDPKMSFGTGYHATTRLMLGLMEGAVRGGERVLDVGTGTGVLAIAAIRLGAAAALGVDIDEWSYDNAMENVVRNGVEGRVEIRRGSLEQASGRFDLILSNITKNDNRGMLDDFANFLPEGGVLILSGFYGSDTVEIESAASPSFIPRETRFEDEWAAIAFTRSAIPA